MAKCVESTSEKKFLTFTFSIFQQSNVRYSLPWHNQETQFLINLFSLHPKLNDFFMLWKHLEIRVQEIKQWILLNWSSFLMVAILINFY